MIRTALVALPMAVIWMMLTGRASLDSFALGYVISAGLAAVVLRPNLENQLSSGIAFGGYLLRLVRDVISADLQVAWTILRPQGKVHSRIIEVPLSNDTELNDDFVTAMSSHAITLTPGTLVVKSSPDNKTLYVHSMNASDEPEALQAEQKDRCDALGRIFDEQPD